MIVTQRAAKVSAQAATKLHAATKSGLQTHPLILLLFRSRLDLVGPDHLGVDLTLFAP
jgi:hypothetical protein